MFECAKWRREATARHKILLYNMYTATVLCKNGYSPEG